MTDGGPSLPRPPTLPRRTMLALAVLAPAALAAAGCSGRDPGEARAAEQLRGLAVTARSDAALVAAALAADPSLTDRLDPLRAARLEHAQALETEVARLESAQSTTAASAPDTGNGVTRSGPPVGLADVRRAVASAAITAAEAALTVPPAQVGLVASVAACCAAYAAELE